MKTTFTNFVAVCLLCFASFGVKAADVQVNINDISGPVTVAAIKTAIDGGISATGGSGTVTVIYHNGSDNVPYINATTTSLVLAIPSGVTVVWSLEYSGTASLVSTAALIDLSGAGIFTVESGGSITASSSGHAITVRSGSFTLNVNAGGQVISPGANSNSAIQVGANLQDVVINVDGGSVISESGGFAIEDAPGSGSDSFSNNTSINIGNDAGTVVRAGTSSAIRSRGTGSIVTVNGGTVSNAASNNNNPAINMSGSSIEDVIINDGKVESISNPGYAIQTTGDISVNGGWITAINGRAINLVGVNSIATVSGGMVETTGSGVALSTATTAGVNVDNTTITVTGGTVKANTGNAIHTTGAASAVTVSGGLVYNETTSNAIDASVIYAQYGGAVEIESGGMVEARGSGNAIGGGGTSSIVVSGGLVTAKQGSAIRKTTATGTVTVNGGFVFAYGNTITGSGNTIYMTSGSPVINPSPGDDGVVVAWNQTIAGSNPTYYAESTTDITQSPTGAMAIWQKDGTENGIAYDYNGNAGFFPLDVQILFPVYPDAYGIFYVDYTKSGDGSSWDQAYPNLADPLLQAAIQRTIQGYSGVLITQIWVAEGTYYPMHTASGYDLAGQVFDVSDGGSDNAFVLVPGVQIYGGFAGSESSVAARSGGASVLSGDIDYDGTLNNNVYHVLVGVDIPANANTVIDGFTVTGGNAAVNSGIVVKVATIEGNSGGGMYNVNASPVLTNMIFSENYADSQGGGIYNYVSSPALFNVIMSGNSAASGGGMFNDDSSPALTNVTISGNSAFNDGGGMYNDASSPTLANVTVSGNYASNVGGGMMNDDASPRINNSILWGNEASADDNISDAGSSAPVYNYSLVGGSGISGNGNIDVDPVFVAPVAPNFAPTTAGDYSLQSGSPAIEAGNNNLYLTARGITGFTDETDLAGNQRLSGATIDMGAYETTVYLTSIASDGTSSTGGGYYGEGDVVHINAGDPPAGFRFVGWTTTTPGVTFDDPFDPITFFVMPNNPVALRAEFKAVYTVTVVNNGTGASGDVVYLQGETVNIDAGTPFPGHPFVRWITTSPGVTFVDETNPITAFTMPANDVVVIAEYDDIYVVVVSDTGADSTGDGYYHEGETVHINAGTPPAGMEFSGWTADPEVIFANADSPTTTFVMPANTVIIAARYCFAGDKQMIANAQHLFEKTEWSVDEQVSYTPERLKIRLIEQINNAIKTNGITIDYSDITISRIIPPVVNTNGSFRFTVTLSKCSYIRVLNLTCLISPNPYPPIIRLITIDAGPNGRIESDWLYVAAHETVTLNILPDAGYQLGDIWAYHTEYITVSVPLTGDGDVRTFLMPPHPVTVVATFTIATGIHDIQTDGGMKAYVQDGVLYVSGVAQGATMRVYTILGTVVAAPSGSPEGGEFVISLPGRGIYIITDGKKTIKINN